VPLPGVPFDERASVVPNALGRVLDSGGSPLPGEYVAGWLKRGPTGVIGTNKSDAGETVRGLLEDLAGGPGADGAPLPRAGLLRYPDRPAAAKAVAVAPGSAGEAGFPVGGPELPAGLGAGLDAEGVVAAEADWPLGTVLAGRGIMPVSYAEWLRIETAEIDLAKSLGRGERVKLHDSDAIWSACRPQDD
jgi:ferredoxin/flavodoxin---NADP+ reductase